jgi:N-acyl-D-amino-acid deacylase
VGNDDRYAAADPARMGDMRAFLEEHLDRGCVGLSLGLEYIPGIEREEATSLMNVAAARDKLTAVHQRSDGNLAIAAVNEAIAYAEATGSALQISHLSSMCSFGSMEAVLSIIDSGRSRGANVGFDGYPYYAFCTHLGSAVFDDGFLDKYSGGDALYEKIRVASGEKQGLPLDKASFRNLRAEKPDTLIVAHLLDEREVDMCLLHPAGIVISDGLYDNGQGHPRGSGTFPKLIHDYVYERKQLTLDVAVEKITRLPALRLGLKNKGTLSAGADADITIFDPAKIEDKSTYAEPFNAPFGVEYVVIGGGVALRHGEIIDGSLGRAIRE